MRYHYNLGLAFEYIAASHAERPALIPHAGRSISYADLNRRSNQLAHWLKVLGLRRRDVLALFNTKSSESLALMLAALKIGAPYVNLDDQNPAQRLGRILATCRPHLAVSDHSLPDDMVRCCLANDIPLAMVPAACNLAQLPAEPPADLNQTTGSDPAYLMFTSGSTGTPKGVVISHASVLNFIQWARAEFAISADDVLTGVNPMYFDNSVFDFYASLFNGAALAPLSREIVASAPDLVRRVGELGCTVWFSVPSLLIYLMTMRQLDPATWPALRCLVFGGEGYPVRELNRLFNLFHPRARLVNVYGPTECTCICSAYTLAPADFGELQGLAPLGRLAANFDYLVLTEQLTPAAINEVGELCLLGPQLAMGYYHDPERTAGSFLANPLCISFSERMYRTGDLVRQDEQGLLWFVGRSDNQIKHLGYRIELEEIEAALQTLAGVTQAVALYQRLRDQHGRIVAFVSSSRPVEPSRIREDLRERLPAYMIPGHVECLAELPMNANGKVDRKALAHRLASL
ncbi:MAG: amino acid adenylation domain-containing protein [Candidatus Accumulibacter sp. UW26]|jgi:D-alanine--poly(phosphoribitol) ligase subunit 1